MKLFPIQNFSDINIKKVLIRMEIRQLQYFVAIAEREHFNRASQVLNIAQPALTRQMKLLEAEMGLLLFERLPRGIRLTPAGRHFLGEAREILRQLQTAVSRTQAAALGRAGQLRLGVIEMGAWQGLIPDSLRQFRREFPAVALDLAVLSSPSQIEALRARKLDAGLLYYPPKQAGFHAIPLIRHPVMIALPAEDPRAAQAVVRLADLADAPFIGFRRPFSPQFHDEIHAECRARDFLPRFITETASEADMLALVSAGAGVCFVNSCQRWREPHAVRILPLADFEVSLELFYVYPEDDPVLPVAGFRRVVEAVLAAQTDQPAAAPAKRAP